MSNPNRVQMPCTPPMTPTLDARKLVVEESNAIGRFLDWLNDEGIQMAKWYEPSPGMWRLGTSLDDGPDALLHRYFKIDPKAEERELRALLDYQRCLNTAGDA